MVTVYFLSLYSFILIFLYFECFFSFSSSVSPLFSFSLPHHLSFSSVLFFPFLSFIYRSIFFHSLLSFIPILFIIDLFILFLFLFPAAAKAAINLKAQEEKEKEKEKENNLNKNSKTESEQSKCVIFNLFDFIFIDSILRLLV